MKRIWTEHYPQGVPDEVTWNNYRNIGDLLIDNAKKFKKNTAYTHMGIKLSYRRFLRLTRRFVAYLQNNLKLKKGDKIALMMPNCLTYPVALFAALRSGIIVVNMNPQYTPREVKAQLEDSGAKVIVVLDLFADTLNDLDLDQVVVTQISDFMPWWRAWPIRFVLKYIKHKVPKYTLKKSVHFKKALWLGKLSKYQNPQVTQNDIAFLQYTGGTTGVAKAAVLTHGNMLANVAQASAWLKPVITPGEEVIITALPLYHIFSLMANCILFFTAGANNVLITDPKNIPSVVKQLATVPFTAMTGVNTLYNAFIHSKGFRSLDFSHFKLALAGGMALTQAVAEKFHQLTGVPILEAYGLTETSPGVCINPLNIKTYNGTVGLPLPSTDISIRDEKGQEVGIDEPGELCVKGPQVLQGYWQKPDETKQVLSDDGWFATGDIARINAQGYISIVDRKKDMILSSGFNVYPNEIEDVLMLHDGVLEVAAIGVPHKIAGQVVKVFIVKKDPELTKHDVIEHCRKNLTSYKIPKHVEFRSSLPKTNVGKILRRKLTD